MNYSQFVGNTMATRNQIVFAVWIMKSLQIPRAKSSKQIYLDNLERERVGVIRKDTPEMTAFLRAPLWQHIS